MFRNAVWQQVGGFSRDPAVRFAEDYDFLVRVANTVASIGSLADVLYPTASTRAAAQRAHSCAGPLCGARQSAGICRVASLDGSRDSLCDRCRGANVQLLSRLIRHYTFLGVTGRWLVHVHMQAPDDPILAEVEGMLTPFDVEIVARRLGRGGIA